MERPGAPKDRDPVHEVAPLPTASHLHYSPFLFLEDVLPWRVQRSFLGDREGTEKVHEGEPESGVQPSPTPRGGGQHRAADWDLLLSTAEQQQNH